MYNRHHCNVVTEIDQHRKGSLKQCQERNRIFFGKGVMTSEKFLARRGLPFLETLLETVCCQIYYTLLGKNTSLSFKTSII